LNDQNDETIIDLYEEVKELENSFGISMKENRLRMLIEIEVKVAELFSKLQALKNGFSNVVIEEEEKFDQVSLTDLIARGLTHEKLMKYSRFLSKFESKEPEKINLFNLNTILNLISETDKNINAREKLVVNGSRVEIFSLLT
jgi:activator of HSP90 ATPase